MFIIFKVIHSLSNTLIILAYAGLVTNTPTVTPIIVASANPFNKPAPAHQRGINATKEVK